MSIPAVGIAAGARGIAALRATPVEVSAPAFALLRLGRPVCDLLVVHKMIVPQEDTRVNCSRHTCVCARGKLTARVDFKCVRKWTKLIYLSLIKVDRNGQLKYEKLTEVVSLKCVRKWT